MKADQMMQLLLSGKPLSLAAWLADPLPGREAAIWLAEIRDQLRSCYEREQFCFQVRLAEIIARHWCGADSAMNYQNLLAVLDSRRQRAQLELCYGQLMIATKRRGAWQHLDCGFELAANLLEPEGYFVVMRRHDSLRHLPLSDQGAAPTALGDLLREAAVISRLVGPGRSSGLREPRHRDTVD